MSAAPSRIWIARASATMPEWVVEHMASGDVAADGSFDISGADGPARVESGFAVFEVDGSAYACPPRLVQAKLAEVSGAAPEIVEQVREDSEARVRREREQSRMPQPHDADYQLKLKPIVGDPPAPQFVALSALRVDDSYQRSIEGGASRKLIVKIAENWDWRLCLPLIVSRRAGVLYVIDGQHRMEGARLRGDIAHLPVVIFDFEKPEAEAELFIAANRSRRPMSKLDDHHAAVTAGDKKALAIEEIVTGAGLAVGRVQAWQYWKPGEVVFVTSIKRLMHTAGKDVVSQALRIIGKAFEGQVLVGVASLFEGLVAFLKGRVADGKPVTDELMELVLAQTGIPGWKEAVDGIDGAAERADAMLAAIVAAYTEAEAE